MVSYNEGGTQALDISKQVRDGSRGSSTVSNLGISTVYLF